MHCFGFVDSRMGSVVRLVRWVGGNKRGWDNWPGSQENFWKLKPERECKEKKTKQNDNFKLIISMFRL